MTIVESARVGVTVRGEFPIFEHKTYLNSCSQGALSLRVRAAYEEYLAGWDENGAEWGHWVERAETMRAAFARLLHAERRRDRDHDLRLAGGRGLVERAALRGLGAPRIVISDYEFPTVGQIAHAQELRGAEVVHVRPATDGSIPPERFAEVVDERTALVCCTAVSYRTGHRHDIEAVARIATHSGALCLADGYQAIGAVDLDPGTLGVDFMTGGTVKYLLASAGLGFLYVRTRPARAVCSRPRPDGSPTRTSSRWTSTTTRRPLMRAASMPGRRRCRTSTPASPGSR